MVGQRSLDGIVNVLLSSKVKVGAVVRIGAVQACKCYASAGGVCERAISGYVL